MNFDSRHPLWMLGFFCWTTLQLWAVLGVESHAESGTAENAGVANISEAVKKLSVTTAMAGTVQTSELVQAKSAWPIVILPKDLRIRESFSLGLVNGEQLQITCLNPHYPPVSLWSSHLPQVIQQGQQSWPAILQHEDAPLAKAFAQLWPSQSWPDHFWTQIPMARRWLLLLSCGVFAIFIIYFNPPYKLALSIVMLLALIALPSYQRSLGIVEGGQFWRCSREPSPADVLVYQTPKGEPFYLSVFNAADSPNAQNLENNMVGPKDFPHLASEARRFLDAHHVSVHASFWSELILIQPQSGQTLPETHPLVFP